MPKINLRELYPYYKVDSYVEVTDALIEAIKTMERKESAYERRVFRNRAFYSLDREDGIEYDAVFVSRTPEEYYERKVTYEQLYAAMATLPDKQANRIYAYFFMNRSYAAIARAEGVTHETVRISILNGLVRLEKHLKRDGGMDWFCANNSIEC